MSDHRSSEKITERLNVAIEQERRYANEPYAQLLVDARDQIERLSRDSSPVIVGWAVGDLMANPAMYNLAQKTEAFKAAKRWGRPITALVLHPEAPTP